MTGARMDSIITTGATRFTVSRLWRRLGVATLVILAINFFLWLIAPLVFIVFV